MSPINKDISVIEMNEDHGLNEQGREPPVLIYN